MFYRKPAIYKGKVMIPSSLKPAFYIIFRNNSLLFSRPHGYIIEINNITACQQLTSVCLYIFT